jgi:CRP/FNR family transcriptional regulator, cyclic AMP receptor protein
MLSPMARTSATTYLSRVPLFAGCSKKHLATIARFTDELELPDGKVLTREGDTSREAFVITSGKAVVSRNGRKIAELGPGDTVGELGLLDNARRSATVVTDGAVSVLVIGRREFSALLHDVPGIAQKLLLNLAATIRDLDEKSYG